jgi:uncharacterized protein
MEALSEAEAPAAAILAGTVDCDVHPEPPTTAELLPHLDPFLRESITQRGIGPLTSVSYPPNAPMTVREDWRGEPGAGPALARMQRDLFDGLGVGTAILNPLYGLQVLMSEDMAARYATGLNTFTAREWLDRDPRLRSSIVVPMQNPEMAVEEIDRWAGDPRFVQVMMLVMGEMPAGKRYYWPIYKAAERHGLPVTLHAGSMYRHGPTGLGWPSFHAQDYAANATAFQTALTSLICEGVFSVCPDLKVVLAESGFTWLPGYLWRLDKYWHGLRMEVPWVDRRPAEIIASNVRFTLQPVDAPPTAADLQRLMEHVGCEDLLLFSTDYPHWQFDGNLAVPDGISATQARRMMIDTPRATYARLSEVMS